MGDLYKGHQPENEVDLTLPYGPVDDGFISGDVTSSFRAHGPQGIQHQSTLPSNAYMQGSAPFHSFPTNQHPNISEQNLAQNPSMGTQMTNQTPIAHIASGSVAPRPPAVSMIVQQQGGGSGALNAPKPPALPERRFDAYSLLTITKTITDIVGLYALLLNDFSSGFFVAALGLIIAFVFRLVGNCLMSKEKLKSGVNNATCGFYSILNTVFGTRYGFIQSFEEILARNKEYNEEEQEPRNLNPNMPMVAELIVPESKAASYLGGSETLKVGPRTLTSVAEVVQQGFVFYPLMILFLEFGFGGDVKAFEIILFSSFFSFSQIMCWLIAPSVNVSYGYVYLATWMSFTVPFLLILLFSTKGVFDEPIPVSFYTDREIYAWLKTCIAAVMGVVGLAVYNQNISRMLASSDVRVVGPPALLYYQRIMNAVIFTFEVVALLVFLISPNRFVFQNEDEEELIDESRIDAILFTNATFSIWLVIVAYVETISARTAQSEQHLADKERGRQAAQGR